jgi:2'-5' RNA ligase
MVANIPDEVVAEFEESLESDVVIWEDAVEEHVRDYEASERKLGKQMPDLEFEITKGFGPAILEEGEPVDKAGRGVMVGWFLPPELAKELVEEDGEGASDLHLTLLYFGKDLTNEQVEQVHRRVEQFAAQHAPLQGKLDGAARFPASESSNGMDVLVRLFNVPYLEAFREKLREEIKSVGVQAYATHGYIPHCTLAYVDAGSEADLRAVPVEITIDALTVAIGGVRTAYPLNGSEVVKGNTCHVPSGPKGGQFCSVAAGYNSRIPHDNKIPLNWKEFKGISSDPVMKDRPTRPGHCQENAIALGKKGYTVVAGVTVDRQYDTDPTAKVYPNTHVWNLDRDGRIVDITYGREEAKTYRYIGQVITDKKLLSSPKAIDTWIWQQREQAGAVWQQRKQAGAVKKLRSDAVSGGGEASKSLELHGNISKVDKDRQLVFGWVTIAEEDGKPLVDLQGDVISEDEMERMAYQYVLDCREAGEMHERVGIGKLVESMVFTREKQQALGIDLGHVAWWCGFHISDPEVWKKVKDGTYKAFSIHGKGIREKIAKFNSCHVPGTGKFCSTRGSGSGGVGGGSSASVTSVGKHVKSVSGNKKEAEELVAEISSIDEKFDGALLPFLEKYPLKKLVVSDTPNRVAELRNMNNAAYNVGSGTLYMRSSAHSLAGHPALDSSSTVGGKLKGMAAQRSTLTHEVGHHVFETLDRQAKSNDYRLSVIKAFREDTRPPSPYAKTNFREYFSESFAQYALDKSALSKTARKMVEGSLARAK